MVTDQWWENKDKKTHVMYENKLEVNELRT